MNRLGTLMGAAMLATTAGAAIGQTDPLAPIGQWSIDARGSAPVPPMGWNSWNAFNSDIDETKLLASATALVTTGLAAKGYRYVDIDDGWWLKRRMPDGRLIIRAANFPSAATPDGATSFRPLTDRLHAMGLKAGIYSDIGRNTCGQAYTSNFANQPQGRIDEREVGLYGHVDQDIALFMGAWGFDLLKVDGCGIRAMTPANPHVESGDYRALGPLIDYDTLPDTDIAGVRKLYEAVAVAMARTRPAHDYVFSLCLWGGADVRSWARFVGQMSRTSQDISPDWERMLHNFDSAVRRELYAHPGSWNDPDMLYIGTGAFTADHPVEARTHLTLWAMLSAPLMIGYDLRKLTPALLDILGNRAIIALDQDPAGNQAVLAFDSDTVQILVKTLADGDKAVAIVNRTAAPADAVLTARHMKLRPDTDIALTDLWSGTISHFRDEQPLHLAGHETRVFRVRGVAARAQGLYLSEQTGRVNPAVDGIVEPEADPLVHRGVLPWRSTRGDGEHPAYGGWGGARADSTPYGQALKLHGMPLANGIGVLANSRIEVKNAGYRRFSAQVGIDDSARDRRMPVRFAVYGDGRLLKRTEPVPYGAVPVAIDADVTGVAIIELVARGAADPRYPDPVAWGEAALDR
ncbi:NPCBM/NEW2 domain-containing protein [Novosphingobium sp.]|uniref:NPCBM/NEW2 domain-containing protein n=1 Tax=Novosphingobium sp. TaxID=1874826 RepID=UPI003D0B14BC